MSKVEEVAEVERAIITAQKHVAEFQPNPPKGVVQITAFVNNHETSTCYIVIDPILRALGWELSNPTEVRGGIRSSPQG